MKTILLIFSCLLLLCCTTEKRKVTTVHSPNDTVDVYAKDVTGQKIYNVISEKVVMDNGDPLFGKIRTEVPKQLNDKEFELVQTPCHSTVSEPLFLSCQITGLHYPLPPSRK